jgi:probable phosphoglycerate mutase
MTTINPMPLRLYLIRHGETEWTLSGQHTGRTEIPLTARGEDEAKALGLRLRTIPFAHVLTSPRQRSRRTCELVGLAPEARIDPGPGGMGLWRLRRRALRGHSQGASGLEPFSRRLSAR